MKANELYFESADYARKHPTWHSEDSPWKAEQVLRILGRNDLVPARIAEVGCGSGLVLKTLHDRLPDSVSLVGYESAKEAYEICSHLRDERLHFILGDPLEQKVRFDLICCLDVIEHVEDYLSFLRKLRPLADHHVFHIPLEITVERVLRPDGFGSVRRKYNHLHHFTRQTALAALADTGYRVLDSLLTPSEIVLPIKSVGQAIARVPRRLMYLLHKGLAARTTGGVSLLVLTG